MEEKRNIFLAHKKTMLEIARANHVDTSVAANIACQMAREALTDKPISYSTDGVTNFMQWVADVENLSVSEIADQMVEYNHAASKAINDGHPWTLAELEDKKA